MFSLSTQTLKSPFYIEFEPDFGSYVTVMALPVQPMAWWCFYLFIFFKFYLLENFFFFFPESLDIILHNTRDIVLFHS